MTDVTTTRLGELEAVIQRGLDTFVEVGAALLEIRDARLYRETHGTFEEYCQHRWGMSRRHANRTIEAAGVAGVLGPIGPTPASESVARELTPVLREDPERVPEVWGEVVQEHGPEPTAKQVRETVERCELDPDPEPPNPTERLRSELIDWFAQGRVIRRLLDDDGPSFTHLSDRESLASDATLMVTTAERLKGVLSS